MRPAQEKVHAREKGAMPGQLAVAVCYLIHCRAAGCRGWEAAVFVVSQAQPVTSNGFYLRVRPAGFTAHMNASAHCLRRVRELAERTLCEAGVDTGTRANVRLVASELMGNSVRACGDHVPLVVEIDAGEDGVRVKVHDPEPELLPSRHPVALDDEEAESGRGLGLVDILAPGWQVRATPVGKQIVCRLPYEQRPFPVDKDL